MLTLKYLIQVLSIVGIIVCITLDKELLGICVFAMGMCLDNLLDTTAISEAIKHQQGGKRK